MSLSKGLANTAAAAAMGLAGLACSPSTPVTPKAPEVQQPTAELSASQVSPNGKPLSKAMALYFRDVTLGAIKDMTTQLTSYDLKKCKVTGGKDVTFSENGGKVKLEETIACPEVGGIEKVTMEVECNKVVSSVKDEKTRWADCLDTNPQGKNVVTVNLKGKGDVEVRTQADSKSFISAAYAMAEGKMTDVSRGLVGNLRQEYTHRLAELAKMVEGGKSPCEAEIPDRGIVDIDGFSTPHQYYVQGICTGKEGSAMGKFQVVDQCIDYSATNADGKMPRFETCNPGGRTVEGHTTTGFKLSLVSYLQKGKGADKASQAAPSVSEQQEEVKTQSPTVDKKEVVSEIDTDCQFTWKGNKITPDCKGINNESIPKENWHKSKEKGMVVVAVEGVVKGKDGVKNAVVCAGITIPKEAPESNKFAVEGVKCSVKEEKQGE